MLQAEYKEYKLEFVVPVVTSRGSLSYKSGYLIKVWDTKNPEIKGIGECSILSGLSYDDKQEYEQVLKSLCSQINLPLHELVNRYVEWPSMIFGVETALLDLKNGGRGIIFESRYTRSLMPIPINGLVWMGDYDFMLSQIEKKVADGYKVLKLKIGGIDFDKELDLLRIIRSSYDASKIKIRLDANGAFTCTTALGKLNELAPYDIHSLEQPIKAGQPAAMKNICNNSPIPIALDEEIIGHHDNQERSALVEAIQPQYLVFKPSLIGGFGATNEWIKICNQTNTKYWITSALESNIGLNAIAQYTASIETFGLEQGLGTGMLFKNNFPTHQFIENGQLWFSRKSNEECKDVTRL